MPVVTVGKMKAANINGFLIMYSLKPSFLGRASGRMCGAFGRASCRLIDDDVVGDDDDDDDDWIVVLVVPRFGMDGLNFLFLPAPLTLLFLLPLSLASFRNLEARACFCDLDTLLLALFLLFVARCRFVRSEIRVYRLW